MNPRFPCRCRSRSCPRCLVMLEVGAFHPAWGDIHLGPENALKALDGASVDPSSVAGAVRG